MGWKEKLAKKAKKAARSVIRNAEYCTSVLNDFSFVKKALFQVYRIGDNINKGEKYLDREFEYIEQFPVQINPDAFDFHYGVGHLQKRNVDTRIDQVKSVEGIDLVHRSEAYAAGNFGTKLTYNIYDEYNAVTANGALSDDDTISLHTGTHTSMCKLREYAGLPDYYVLFLWGEIHIFGFLESVDIDYDTFSPWGQPLVGTANISIVRQALGFDDEGRELDPCECPHLKSGKADAKEFDYAAKGLRRMYQGVNAMR